MKKYLILILLLSSNLYCGMIDVPRTKLINKEYQVQPNMLVYFPMNEGTTAYIYNAIGDTNTLTGLLKGGMDVTGWTSGKFGNGLYFDGVDDYVSCGGKTQFESIKDTFTYVAWIMNVSTLSAYRPIIGKSAWYQRTLILNAGKNLRMAVQCEGPDSESVSSINIATGVWYNVAGSYKNHAASLFINGEESPYTSRNFSTGTAETLTFNEIQIGGGISDFFNGYIDEVAIYNIALSSQQIRDLYKKGVREFYK